MLSLIPVGCENALILFSPAASPMPACIHLGGFVLLKRENDDWPRHGPGWVPTDCLIGKLSLHLHVFVF